MNAGTKNLLITVRTAAFPRHRPRRNPVALGYAAAFLALAIGIVLACL